MTGRFVSRKDRTRLFNEAVKSLVDLEKESRLASRAYAEAMHGRYLEDFAKSKGWKQSSAHPCWRKLVGKRCRHFELCDCWPPRSDHVSLWRDATGPVAIVSQPYGLGSETLREIIDFCDKRGLEFHIDAWPSWHFPGSVLTVVFTKTDGETS